MLDWLHINTFLGTVGKYLVYTGAWCFSNESITTCVLVLECCSSIIYTIHAYSDFSLSSFSLQLMTCHNNCLLKKIISMPIGGLNGTDLGPAISGFGSGSGRVDSRGSKNLPNPNPTRNFNGSEYPTRTRPALPAGNPNPTRKLIFINKNIF